MLKDSQVDLCGRTDFTRTAPLLARDEVFSFACAGCGGCCRGREDIVLSGFDLWRIAARLRLPPRTVARAFCRGSIGRVSRLPVLRLAPVKEERGNCPFLTGNHCAIHDAEPLVCALYPLAQEITKDGQVSYFLQPRRPPMCAGRRCAWRWKIPWSGWRLCLSRCLPGGCRKSCGRRCITGTTLQKSTAPSWKKICSGWTVS